MSLKEAYNYLSKIDAPLSTLAALIELRHEYELTLAIIDRDLANGSLSANSFEISLAKNIMLQDLEELNKIIGVCHSERGC